MAEQFYTILTNIGKAKIANAGALGIKVDLSTLVLGDGNGSYYNPNESQLKLVNEVYRRNINNVSIDSDNPNWIVIETVVPSAEGGFTIREVGCLDTTGDLIVVGKYPETYKPKVEDGAVKDLTVKIIMEVSNAENVIIKVDPSVILATKKDLEEATKPVSKTYEELKQMIQDKKLIQGRKYLLTDYKTKYQQPTTLTIKEMAVEQLVLTANSSNSFEPIVSSPTYPQDIITYRFEDNVCEDKATPRTGFIQRRTDTITKNDCPQDWRTMLWARYKPDTTQYYKDGVLTNYSVWTSGNAVIGVIYKSGNSLYMAKNTNVPTSATDENVFYQVYEDINVGMLIEEKTKIADKIELKKGELHERLTFGNNCASNYIGKIQVIHNNVFGNNCEGNIFGADCNKNTFNNNSLSNTLASGCFQNLFLSKIQVRYNSFGNTCFENILIGANGTSFGSGCYYNIISYANSNNSFGNKCYNNTLASNCSGNSFGNECYSNVFADDCDQNSFGNYCYSNTLSTNCGWNVFENFCQSNTLGGTCGSNYFGSACYSNILGYSCRQNVFNQLVHSNTFGMNMWYANVEVLADKNTSNITIINGVTPKTITCTVDGKYVYWYLNSSNQPVYTVIP